MPDPDLYITKMSWCLKKGEDTIAFGLKNGLVGVMSPKFSRLD